MTRGGLDVTGAIGRRSYEERVSRVIAYVVDHLDDELDLRRLAEIACLSPHHRHRVLGALRGETIAATVKRLRLDRAATYLVQTALAIDEIAKRSGYGNVQSFTRILVPSVRIVDDFIRTIPKGRGTSVKDMRPRPGPEVPRRGDVPDLYRLSPSHRGRSRLRGSCARRSPRRDHPGLAHTGSDGADDRQASGRECRVHRRATRPRRAAITPPPGRRRLRCRRAAGTRPSARRHPRCRTPDPCGWRNRPGPGWPGSRR
jgi:AraC-like DNA-binding protein